MAELGRTALGARACVIAWDAPSIALGVSSAASGADEELSGAKIALAALGERPGARTQEIRPTKIARNVTGAVYCGGSIAVRIAVADACARGAPKAEAILELVGRAAIAGISAAESARSLDFWRGAGSAALAERAAVAEAGVVRDAGRDALERIAAQIAALEGAERFATMGAAVARALDCGKWIVAAPRDGALRIVAAARGVPRPRELEEASAISECSRSGRPATHRADFAPRRELPEDKLLGDAWIVFASGPAVIGLGEGDVSAAGFGERAKTLGTRLAPILRAWIAEDALGEHRALVTQLALRMYAAIDEERARIARDLHDDQAQLLAAAQIALEGGGQEARNLFRQISQELRARIRELKPPSLKHTTLAQALEAELGGMRRQGMTVHLLRGKGAARISAPVQRLCWQIAREALANVARHSGASAVEVAIERDDRCSRVIVRDNGHGMATDHAARATLGIGGIRERLELMGGTLAIESSASGTILRAEIPEPA
ncbi:MAG: sensor histidine kinase [Candidatus Binataceae bacterium]